MATVVHVGATETAVVTPGWRASQETLSVRRKAGSTLVRLARDCSLALLPFLDNLASAAQSLIQRSLLTDAETSLMLEAVLLVGLASPSEQQRAGYVARLLDPLLDEIRSGTAMAMVAERASFLDAVGIVTLSGQGARGHSAAVAVAAEALELGSR